MHELWIKKLETSLVGASQMLKRVDISIWVSLALERITDARARINSIKASASQLHKSVNRNLAKQGMSPLDGLSEHTRYIQLNALRIAIIDLNEICEDLTNSYWVCVLSLNASEEIDTSKILTIISDRRDMSLRRKIRGSCGQGHEQLNKLRNAFSHYPFSDYASKVLNDGTGASVSPTSFRFEPMPQDPKNRYYTQIFDPLCQLGERGDLSEFDFTRIQRNSLNASLFSAGRVAADMAETFHQNLTKLIGVEQGENNVHKNESGQG